MVDFDPALPDTAHVGDSGHTDDHNAIVAALTLLGGKMDAAEARLDALEGTPALIPYGPAFNMDALANLLLGGPDETAASYRFRAEQSSTLTAFVAYWLDETFSSDYGGGTGGTFSITVEGDDDGEPDGTPLATESVAPTDVFPVITFSTPATLTAGTLYHLVFTNVDASPTVNYSSIDCTAVFGALQSQVPRQPKWSDDDLAALVKEDGTWTEQTVHTPIIDLTYGNGQHQGQTYMEIESTELVIAGTDNMVRERITVSGGSRVVTGAAVRMAKNSGTGDLTVRLEDGLGVLIDSFTVPASSIPTLDSAGLPSGAWVSGSFTSPRTLTNGSTYHLRLSTDASTEMWTRGMESAHVGDMDQSLAFSDGVLETTTDGSTWETVSGLGNYGDMQFYFT